MSLLSNFQLAAYLYKIENNYFDFATFQKLATKTGISAILKVIVELKNKFQILHNSTILPTYFVTTTLSGS